MTQHDQNLCRRWHSPSVGFWPPVLGRDAHAQSLVEARPARTARNRNTSNQRFTHVVTTYRVTETSVQTPKNIICSILNKQNLDRNALQSHLRWFIQQARDGTTQCSWWDTLRTQQFQARLCPLSQFPVSSGGVLSKWIRCFWLGSLHVASLADLRTSSLFTDNACAFGRPCPIIASRGIFDVSTANSIRPRTIV